MTFRNRVILGYTVMLVITTAVILVSLSLVLEQYTLRQIDRTHAFEALEIRKADEREDSALREAHWTEHLRAAEEMFRFRLRAPDGRIVYESADLRAGDEEAPARTSRGREVKIGRLADCWVSEHDICGYDLIIATPLAEPFKLVRHFEHIAELALIGVVVLSLATGALYARWLVGPLRKLADAAARIDTGEAERIPAALAVSQDEIGSIARRLNAGYERLSGSIDRLRVFSAEVSHELRTPLSIVRLNAERMRDHPESPPAVREMADEQIAEILRQKRFISNLLGFAKLDSGAVRMDIRSVDTAAWISDFAEDATALAEDAGRRFESFNTCNCPVAFDRVWIRQVLFNLLGNALRFSPPGGLLSLSSFCDAGDFVITFTDDGPGVPEPKLAEIFERYSRFGEERGPAEGVGLGLAICRSVVALHGGTIRAENRADRSGLRIVIRLPQKA